MANCPYCGKELVEHERFCWYCEQDLSGIQDKEEKPRCFIATAVYGESAYETQLIRDFRDEKLKNSFFGRVFIDLYYLSSPRIADFISKNETLKVFTKKILNPVVSLVERRYRR